MNAVESITLVFLPLTAFLCVFVAMWWCLIYNKNGKKEKAAPGAGKDTEDFRVEIAKTASKEESVGDGASPSLGFEPSVLTVERFDPITEEIERNSPHQKRKMFLSSRWLKTQEEKKEEEDLELGAVQSIDDEDLTLENYETAIIATIEEPARTPTRVIKSFLSRKSLAASESLNEGAVPTEIFSERLAFSDMESHPDDETAGGLDNENDNNTLASNDVYTLG